MISAEQLWAMPAKVADGLARRRSPTPERLYARTDGDLDRVHEAVVTLVRLPVRDPFAVRCLYTLGQHRSANIILHNSDFGGSEGADWADWRVQADLVVGSNRMCWTRKALRDVLEWVFIEHGVGRLFARIRASDTRTQFLAHRFGFKQHGRDSRHFLDGEDAIVWTLEPAACRWLYANKQRLS